MTIMTFTATLMIPFFSGAEIEKVKDKLINIVLGDNRVEVNWGRDGKGTQVYRSNFAPDADDKKLTL